MTGFKEVNGLRPSSLIRSRIIIVTASSLDCPGSGLVLFANNLNLPLWPNGNNDKRLLTISSYRLWSLESGLWTQQVFINNLVLLKTCYRGYRHTLKNVMLSVTPTVTESLQVKFWNPRNSRNSWNCSVKCRLGCRAAAGMMRCTAKSGSEVEV